jgi:hypothetical protein
VSKLYETAAVITAFAPHEVEGPARYFLRRISGKNSRQVLVTQVHDGHQLTVAAYAAPFDLTEFVHRVR